MDTLALVSQFLRCHEVDVSRFIQRSTSTEACENET